MSGNPLTLDLLPDSYAVVRLPPGAPVPAWATAGDLFSVTRTPTETSILCDDGDFPPDIPAERGFRALRVQGPLDFALVGILESLLRPLAGAAISVFALSTYDTDYVLIPDSRVEEAVEVLTAAGHHIRRPETT